MNLKNKIIWAPLISINFSNIIKDTCAFNGIKLQFKDYLRFEKFKRQVSQELR